jgi:hypothetical protein
MLRQVASDITQAAGRGGETVNDEIDDAYRKQIAGKPFMPHNGTEGELFMEQYCFKCAHDPFSKSDDFDAPSCGLIMQSLGDQQPEEWRYDDEGYPICYKFRHESLGDLPEPIPGQLSIEDALGRENK